MKKLLSKGVGQRDADGLSLEGLLGFFDFFRRPPPIRDAAALADFIDQNSAFVAQKGIYEYSRARDQMLDADRAFGRRVTRLAAPSS